MRAKQGAGGPGALASASGCLATHVGQGSPWPGRVGRWEGDPGSGTPCRFSQGAERPQTSRAGGVGARGEVEGTALGGGTARMAGHAGRASVAPGEGGPFVRTGLSVGHEAEAGERTGTHAGLTGLLRAGAKCGLHPGCGIARKERGPECRPRAGGKPPPQASPPTLLLAPMELPGPRGAGWGDIPTQASAAGHGPSPSPHSLQGLSEADK